MALNALVLMSILIFSVGAQPPPAAPQPAPPLVKENATIKVSEHVYAIPDGSVPLVPNVGIVVGSRATMVVDTGLGPRNGQAILREVAKVSKNTELDALRPAVVVPSHGAIGDASLIAKDRDYLNTLRTRVRELKAQGKSADEIAQTVTTEVQAKFPDRTAPMRIGAAARAAFTEAR